MVLTHIDQATEGVGHLLALRPQKAPFLSRLGVSQEVGARRPAAEQAHKKTLTI